MAKLVLVRHGQSIWNQLNEFTGWVDVPLSFQGVEEATRAGTKLAQIHFDAAFTSELIRAHETLLIVSRSLHAYPVIDHEGTSRGWSANHPHHANTFPVTKAQALNERYYGDLQGLNKEETAAKYGAEQVHLWRRSYDIAPPNGESLADVVKRTVPYYEQHIQPLLKQNKNVIVVAHGNSLRSIMMHIEALTPEQIVALELPTATPVCYEVDSSGKAFHKEILE